MDNKKVLINSLKLDKQIKKKYGTYTNAANNMAFSVSFLSGIKTRNFIRYNQLLHLCKVMRDIPENYIEEESVYTTPPNSVLITAEMLKRIDALQDFMADIQDDITCLKNDFNENFENLLYMNFLFLKELMGDEQLEKMMSEFDKRKEGTNVRVNITN